MEINSTKSKSRGAGFIGAIICLIVGFAINPLFTELVDNAKESENWPTVRGVVSTSEIIQSQSKNSDGKMQTMYGANVVVNYTVDNNEFNSNRINIGGYSTTSSRNSVKRTIAPYPVGAEVDVFYDPEDPGFALLEPGLSLFLRLISFLPYFFIGLGVVILIKALLKVLTMVAAVGFLAKNRGEQKTTVTPPPETSPMKKISPETGGFPENKSFSSSENTPKSVKSGLPKDEGEDGFSI